jgi:hypothetical protein
MKIRKTKKENVNIAECSIFQLFQIGTEQDQYRVETMTKHFEKLKDCETLDFLSVICYYQTKCKESQPRAFEGRLAWRSEQNKIRNQSRSKWILNNNTDVLKIIDSYIDS